MDPPTSKVRQLSEIAKLVPDGATIIAGGFYDFGRPDTILGALHDRGLKEIILVTNDPVTMEKGSGLFVMSGQARKIILSFIGTNPKLLMRIGELEAAGKLEMEFIPQGTLIERIRAAGYGLGGVYTPTGVGTKAAEGKEVREIDGKDYVFEKPLTGEFGIVRAWQSDRMGNLRFRGMERNFNSSVARACGVTIAEAEEILEGPLDPEVIHVPHNFVDHVVQAVVMPEGKDAEIRTQHGAAEELIARRIALELKDGDVVNLGIGIPIGVASFIYPGIQIWMQSENGILGMGPPPRNEEEKNPHVIDAGRQYATVLPYGSFFDSADSFGMIRGGHVDVTVLGALEVDQQGNLANWRIPGKLGPGMGGAMDLAAGARRLIVATRHTLKDGTSKLRRECSYPLTAKGVVSLIVTDLAVFEVNPHGGRLLLKEVAPGVSVEEVLEKTEAEVDTSSVSEWKTAGAQENSSETPPFV